MEKSGLNKVSGPIIFKYLNYVEISVKVRLITELKFPLLGWYNVEDKFG